jgi:integrase
MPTIVKRKGKRGVTYIARARVRGHRDLTQTFSTAAAALAWAQAKEAELRELKAHARNVRADVSGLTVRDLIKEYLDDPKTKSQRSFDDTAARLGWWVENLGGERLLTLSVMQLREASDKLARTTASPRRRKRSAATVNRILSSFRSAWNWAIASQLIPPTHPWPTRIMLPEQRGRDRHLSADELKTLLKAAESDPTIRAGIIVSIATGLRASELLRLDWHDLLPGGRKLLVRITKTGKPRTVHLTPAAVAALKGLRGEHVTKLTGPIFTTVTGCKLDLYSLGRRWRPIRTAAGLADFRWHDLRHTTASILGRAGASLHQIGAVLGHSSPVTTARYSHFVEGEAMPQHADLDKFLTTDEATK